MSWGRIDDRLAEHPKWVRLEREHGPRAWADGLAVWTWALCYSCRNETDGAIDATILARATPIGRAAIKAADALVAVGLMDRRGPLYVLHDYTEYNPSREELQLRRRADSERKRGKPAAESERNPSGVAAESEPLPALPTRAGEGARAGDPLPSPPVPSHLPRAEGETRAPRAPASPVVQISLDAEVVRKAAERAFKVAVVVAPRAVREVTGKHWPALVPPLREYAERERIGLEEAADRLMAGFLASERARARSYPIGFLAENPAEYLTARAEPAADIERLLAGIPHGGAPVPEGMSIAEEFGLIDPPRRST